MSTAEGIVDNRIKFRVYGQINPTNKDHIINLFIRLDV